MCKLFKYQDVQRAKRRIVRLLVVGLICLGIQDPVTAVSIDLKTTDYDPACGIAITQQEHKVMVSWQMAPGRRGRLVIDLTDNQPLIQSTAVSTGPGESFRVLAKSLDPVVMLRVGERDLAKRDGWTIFFDRMQRKPHKLFVGTMKRKEAIASSTARRATLRIGDFTAGPFHGYLQWTFYAGNSFVLQEAVLQTSHDGVAYLYDMGLVCRTTLPSRMTWRDSRGTLQGEQPGPQQQAKQLAVRGRAVSAQFENGSIALFPPPHRYFYPLDFSDNLKNIWFGTNVNKQSLPFGFGIRHDPTGDNRYVPWFNAPPGTSQQLGLFWLLSAAEPDQSLQEVARLTREDRFAALPGHLVFSSHYHVEHTRELLAAQRKENESDTSRSGSVGRLPSGGTYRIPRRLKKPGFVRAFQRHGVDIVHLAEFHSGKTPRMTMTQRVESLELLHAECQRLSDPKFLLLPGEEPNVHFGGHWLSFFPQPVYWVLNRPGDASFVKEDPKLGKIYHVGSEADVLRLLKAEGGLAWTAHPRIKSSSGFPDRYRDELFYESDRFLGAAWKAMPADLSQPRLGSRVLDLLDDMSNWGTPKYVLGEVDVFKIEPDHELYAHMNVNYVRMDKIPSFKDGWKPLLDTLSGGRFFVTTGEVLVPEFTVNGIKSGGVARLSENQAAKVRIQLKWTFPLDYAEIITGNGKVVKRQRLDLTNTNSFGEKNLVVDVNLAGQRWVRLEVWDIATNGAFTQPVWLQPSAGR
jgi:hypothetical protein